MRSLLFIVVLIGCRSSVNLSLGSGITDFCVKNITNISPGSDFLAKAPQDATFLSFCENNISSIDSQSFQNFNELESLVLNKNKHLKFLPNAQFLQQDSLMEFSCTGCGVDIIYNQSLSGMPQLEHINLTDNNIELIESGAFHGNQKLKVIDLRWNSLHRLPQEMLEDIEQIQRLDVGYNRNITAEGDQPFLVSIGLQELWCEECGFEIVYENTFSKLLNLQKLNLRRNKITQVHPRAFSQLYQRQPEMKKQLVVSFEDNLLETIDSAIKIGLQLCVYGNTAELECFLRTLQDKDSFICSNSTQPEIECVPPTTSTVSTTSIPITTEAISSSSMPSTVITSTADISKLDTPTPTTTTSPTQPDKPTEEVQGISDAYIGGYLSISR